MRAEINFLSVTRVYTETSVKNGYGLNAKREQRSTFFSETRVYTEISVENGYGLNNINNNNNNKIKIK